MFSGIFGIYIEILFMNLIKAFHFYRALFSVLLGFNKLKRLLIYELDFW